ncbi:MAG TPA: hypothetical protein VKA46_42545 [Gemmataceae bacterium]|nr:hypothetical protein [Gemmataceae bacterium]
MRGLISQLRRWWFDRRRGPAPAEPYDVACPCGQRASGPRQARHQVVRCLACGGPVFVLGCSPLAGTTAEAPAVAVSWRRYWLGPAFAAVLTLTAVVVIFSRLIPALAPPAPPPSERRDDVRGLIAAGREALRHEDFRIAAARFAEARRRRDERPDSLSPAEARELTRLERQAALVADLLSESLDEILQRAAGTREEERQAQFNLRYRDKAVIFDDVVARDAAGRFGLAVYEVRAPGEPARVELSDLKLLKALPLAEPRRMLFGARLAGLGREERGGHGLWVIHLEPESGVLLTDEDAAGACCPRPLDAGLRAVLRQQEEWAAALP